MSQTIKQLADALGVSKTAIRKHLTPDFRAAHTATDGGNAIWIDDQGCALIAQSFRKQPETTANKEPETAGNQVSGDVVALLQATITTLQHQLEVKDRQIAELTETVKAQAVSIHAAQALHAGTMQRMLPDADAADAQAEDASSPERPRKWWQRWRRG
jgi:hypothetical protein